MDERKLVSNPFSSTNGSSQIVVKFNSVDSAHFLGNVGKKVQIRTPLSPEPLTYVGNINMTEALMTWQGIIGEDSVNNSITIDLGSSYVATSTNVDVGGNGPFSMGIITNTHQETDGPVFGNVSLETRTDTQESNNTGTNVGTGLPLDAGYYNPTNKSFTASKINGAIFPYVEKTFTWAQPAGTISQSPIPHSTNLTGDPTYAPGINLGYSSAVTSGGETVDVGPWTISGDSLIGTNLTFNTTTGYLQSNSTSSYFTDTTFTVTVTDTSTGNSQTYSFVLSASGVNNIRSFTGSSSVVSGNLEFGSQCASELDKFWKVNPAIDSNWYLAFGPGNNHLNDASHQNGTKRYGNHTFAYTSADSDLKFTQGNQHDSNWTDQTPPPTLNYTMSLGSEFYGTPWNNYTMNNLPHIWTRGYRPSSINYTLTYLNPTVYVSPGRPTALLGFGQIYPRFFEEVDEETVPAETSSGAGLAEVTYTTNASPPAPATGTMAGLRTSREFLKDKRPRVGQMFPRGNAFRSDEN